MKFKDRKVTIRRKFECWLLVVCLIASPTNTNANLLERYKGSQQEKSLDAQIKAYRKSAIENMRVFGRMEQGPYPLPRSNQGLIKQWHQENPKQPAMTKETSVQTKKKKSENKIPNK